MKKTVSNRSDFDESITATNSLNGSTRTYFANRNDHKRNVAAVGVTDNLRSVPPLNLAQQALSGPVHPLQNGNQNVQQRIGTKDDINFVNGIQNATRQQQRLQLLLQNTTVAKDRSSTSDPREMLPVGSSLVSSEQNKHPGKSHKEIHQKQQQSSMLFARNQINGNASINEIANLLNAAGSQGSVTKLQQDMQVRQLQSQLHLELLLKQQQQQQASMSAFAPSMFNNTIPQLSTLTSSRHLGSVGSSVNTVNQMSTTSNPPSSQYMQHQLLLALLLNQQQQLILQQQQQQANQLGQGKINVDIFNYSQQPGFQVKAGNSNSSNQASSHLQLNYRSLTGVGREFNFNEVQNLLVRQLQQQQQPSMAPMLNQMIQSQLNQVYNDSSTTNSSNGVALIENSNKSRVPRAADGISGSAITNQTNTAPKSSFENLMPVSHLSNVNSETKMDMKPVAILPPMFHSSINESSGSSVTNRSVIKGKDSSNVRKKGIFPIALYNKSDDGILGEYQSLLRQQLELFEANNRDVINGTFRQGRSTPIQLGQIGLRCKHCATSPMETKTKGSVYFSQTIKGIYQIAQNMAKVHLCERCTNLPIDIKKRMIFLRNRKHRASGGRAYWIRHLHELGLYEDGSLVRARARSLAVPGPKDDISNHNVDGYGGSSSKSIRNDHSSKKRKISPASFSGSGHVKIPNTDNGHNIFKIAENGDDVIIDGEAKKEENDAAGSSRLSHASPTKSSI